MWSASTSTKPEQTRAVVLSVDEKSQCQALERSQPILPMRLGQPERRTHDYYRHGTTSLFAALDVASGRIIGRCHKRHRHQEFLRFLYQIEREVPAHLEIHIILDNYGTHKTPKVARWFVRRPRYHLHFTPTSASWLNQIERWFAKITQERIRRDAFRSVAELERGPSSATSTPTTRTPSLLCGLLQPISSSAGSNHFVSELIS
jgi:transposase